MRALANASYSLTDSNGKQMGVFNFHKANMARHYYTSPKSFHRFDDTPGLSEYNSALTPTYNISARKVQPQLSHGLVDGGANGGIGSDCDMRIFAYDLDD